ncbi:MAG: hypothetical protein H0T76_05930 [Nannocystis sp.]|nr:hypothetical protein [Nannocystis sp.]MBA3546000.1 hypothetical protein [Nannocystis sp.]
MNFLKGLFGGGKTVEIEEEPRVLMPAPKPEPPRAPLPPAAPPAPPAPPPFRLATRYSTTIDFPAVLLRAGVDAEQQQRVKKAQELLRSLPDDSPAALKRRIVEAAFTAFDVPLQKIIGAATTEVAALEAFIQEGGAKAQRVLDEGTARIAELDEEIAEIRASMAAAIADQALRDAATEKTIADVKPILAFFAQTQAPGLPDFQSKEAALPDFPAKESAFPDFLQNKDAAFPDFSGKESAFPDFLKDDE